MIFNIFNDLQQLEQSEQIQTTHTPNHSANKRKFLKLFMKYFLGNEKLS